MSEINITINVNSGEDEMEPEVDIKKRKAPKALAGGLLEFPSIDGRALRAPGATGNPILDMMGL